MIVMTVAMMMMMVMSTVWFLLSQPIAPLSDRLTQTCKQTHTHVCTSTHRTKGDQVTSESLDAMLHTHSTTGTLTPTQATDSSNFNFYTGICDFISVFLLYCAVAIMHFELQCLCSLCACVLNYTCVPVYSVTWECSSKHSMAAGFFSPLLFLSSF